MGAIDPLARQKQRLETLADVIYGVAIVLLVSTMPTPSSVGSEDGSLLTFLAESYELLIGDAITLFLIVTYWTQNNAVNGILTRTDGRHSGLSAAQLIVMLVYFYSQGVSAELGDPASTLAFQSACLGVMGLLGIAGLAHASGRGQLLQAGVSAKELRALRSSLIPEPLTAGLTLLAVPFGIDVWSLAWLSYPLVAFVVGRIMSLRDAAEDATERGAA